MPYFLLGISILALLVFGARMFVNTPPAVLAKNLKVIGGVGAMVASVPFFLTGRWLLAAPLAFFGWGLLTGRRMPLPGGIGGGGFGGGLGSAGRGKTAGQTSTVRTAFLEMNLDHDTGLMNGRVLAGRREGALLSDLDEPSLLDLLGEISGDGQSAALLEAYLDRAHPDWRSRDEEAGNRSSGQGGASGPMTRDEALAVLGLAQGADGDAVRSAHRALMRQYHPDRGGSDYLAAKINEAKDVLLGE